MTGPLVGRTGRESTDPTLTNDPEGRRNRRGSATGRDPMIGDGEVLGFESDRSWTSGETGCHHPGRVVEGRRPLGQIGDEAMMGRLMRILVQPVMEFG